MIKKPILIFIVIFLAIDLFAGPKKNYFEKISLEEGLSQSVVVGLAQDRDGFLWVGTEEGLNKYDGYSFTEFKHQEDDENSLSDNYIRAIVNGHDNSLWIATNNGGLNHFDLDQNKITRFIHSSSNSNSISSNSITSLAVDSSGGLWIGNFSCGLDYYNIEKKQFRNYRCDSQEYSEVLNQQVTQLMYDHYRNILWIGTYDGLCFLDLTNNTLTNFNNRLFRKPGSPNKMIRSFLLDDENNVWIGTDTRGLFMLDFEGGKSPEHSKIYNYKNNPGDKFSISGNSINSIIQSVSGAIWVGVWGGGIDRIVKGDSEKDVKFVTYRNDKNDPASLSADEVIVILEDRFGVLWIGTYGDGLNKLTPNSGNFTHYTRNNANDSELTNKRVFALHMDSDDYLWIGTWGGLNSFDTKRKAFSAFRKNGKSGNTISDNRITAISEDIDGDLWIGTLDKGLNRFDKRTKQFTWYLHNSEDKNSLAGDRILFIMPRNNGDVWVGIYNNGISIYDHLTGKFRSLTIPGVQLVDENVRSMLEDSRGDIWLGTYNGLMRYSQYSNGLKSITSNSSGESTISGFGIVSILEDAESNLWVGTFGSGLAKLTYQEESDTYSIKEFHLADGLPNEFIYSLIEDRSGKLWLSTKKGIVNFDPKGEKFITFGEYEGLRFEEFREGACYNPVKDKMYMGGLDGFVEFSPQELEVSYSQPNIVYTDFVVFEKDYEPENPYSLVKEIMLDKEIVLDYNQNSFAVNFVGLNFVSPNSMSYSYKLEGFDPEFIVSSAERRYAAYTNLSPGSYTFVARVSLDTYSKNVAERSFNVIIKPPFYDTLLFQIIALLSIGVILSLIFRWRTLRIRTRNVELKQEVQLRTKELEEINAAKDRFFSVIAHDLKGPFSYLLNTSELLAKEVSQMSEEDQKFLAGNINSSAGNLYNLLENLLDWSKYQMLGLKVNKRMIDVSELLSNNISLLGQLARNKKIQLITKIENDIVIETDEQILNTVVRNLLTNAIKFTREAGEINISVKVKDRHVIIGVCDNGVGMDKDTIEKLLSSESVISTEGTGKEKGTGLGLVLIKEFIEALGGELSIDSEPEKGTNVYCSLPK